MSWQRAVVDRVALVVYLPVHLRNHPNAAPFLDEVARAAQQTVDTRAPMTIGEVRHELADIAVAARSFRNALGALRNMEVEKALRLHAHDSIEAVTRLRIDTDAIEAACKSTVAFLQGAGTTQPDKQATRGLVDRVSRAHLKCFGALPPQRGWFGNDFMPELGAQIGLLVGWEVVGETVKLLKTKLI